MRQLVLGLKDLHSLKIVHRDLKPANVLLHFPNRQKFDKLSVELKLKFLQTVDLTSQPFYVKISDFGLSAIFDDNMTELSIAGTPLYQSPQVLMRQWYDEKVDTWALGCVLYELLTGDTPFQGETVRHLLKQIQRGKYQIATRTEPLCIETCLFLLECLQMLEDTRMGVKGLLNAPLVSEEFARYKLHEINKTSFDSSSGHFWTKQSYRLPQADSSHQENFQSQNIGENSQWAITLTVWSSQMKEELVRQLSERPDLAQFDFEKSLYFKKYL